MCGIAGIIELDGGRLDPSAIVNMCDQMVHRGPDGEGYMVSGFNDSSSIENLISNRKNCLFSKESSEKKVLFGHRRLSIIDLSNLAGQPMEDREGDYWIVFNGEIYNAEELRVELEAKGIRFNTDHSDTEVLLNAYKVWGEGFLHKLNGMFAFCIWNKKDHSFFIARDRLGIKPFYYAVANGKFSFGSELKSLYVDKELNKSFNYSAFYDYLTFTTIAAPNTIFNEVHKLAAGHSITIKNGIVGKQRRYWHPFIGLDDFTNLTEEDLCENLVEQMKSSIELRKRADVEYGLFLSGGLDSSANLAFLSDNGRQRVKTFSVGFDDSIKNYKNELSYARRVAIQFNTQHFEVKMDPIVYGDFLMDMPKHVDEPLAELAAPSLYFLSKLAKENGVTVCIGGEGSDEIFYGYITWRLLAEYESGRKSGVTARNLINSVLYQMPYVKPRRVNQNIWNNRIMKKQQPFWGGVEAMQEGTKSSLVNSINGASNYSSHSTIQRFHNEFLELAEDPTNLKWMAFLDLNVRLPELLLARLDRMTMATSIEGRVPFLDHNMVSFAMSVDDKYKIKNLKEKYILKKALEPYLSMDIIYRGKQGFWAPTEYFLPEDCVQELKSQLRNFNQDTGLFNDQKLEKMFDNGVCNDNWNLALLGIWWKQMKNNNLTIAV